ncbi:ABC transporter substrate-binding protein [Methanofollis aquaemaris]|uniref:ABC transporter substrate-binding protein n=1 Tax=Methanofollis aquaemaris TaxID=126734 RepID=UPI0022403E89|nr:ABC transporter substrate-binding protein [Methanofollis aquaemaris]
MPERNARHASAALLLAVLLVLSAGCVGSGQGGTAAEPGDSGDESYRTVVDSRGVEVQVPTDIKRVVTVSDGMVEGVMYGLGVEDTIVGVGSTCLQRVYNFTWPSVTGTPIVYEDGMNTASYLNPKLMDLPLVGKSGQAINYESLAALNPDLVIIRLGDCTLRYDDENVQKTIDTIESLGIPLVVLKSSHFTESADVSTIQDEIRIIGLTFGKEAEASRMSAYLEEKIAFITDRTQGISESDRPTVLVFGLSPTARTKGGAGVVYGLDTIEARFIEDLVSAKNAYRDEAYFRTVSAEQVLAIDPDVIVLSTSYGFHPPEELYNAPYYQDLQELKAVKEKRVYSMPYTPCNCDKRLEYPLEVLILAKAAHPDRFDDVDLAEWTMDFYMGLYGVDRRTAENLLEKQWLGWMLEDSGKDGEA